MRQLIALVSRHTKVFFRDKGTLLSAMFAPLVMLCLYVFFLGKVFENAFSSSVNGIVALEDGLIAGSVAAYEVSSILAVCCITVAFIANMTIVQDKVSNILCDLTVAPIKSSTLALSYYLSTAIVTMLVNGTMLGVGLIYIAVVGWYLSAIDVFLIISDVVLLSLFGTALASMISTFIKSQGAAVAASTLMSSIYGFISGGYYPISQFSDGVQKVVMMLPGTYGTGLVRQHFFRGYFETYKTEYNFPEAVVDSVAKVFDAQLYFDGEKLPLLTLYLVFIGAIIAFVLTFVIICIVQEKIKTKAKRNL